MTLPMSRGSAASSAAKFWMSRGGFHAEVISTKKLGQVHFSWNGDIQKLESIGVHAVWLPSVEDIYPNGVEVDLRVKEITLLSASVKSIHSKPSQL